MHRQLLVAVLCFSSYASADASAYVDSRIVGGNNATSHDCSHVVAIHLVNRDFLCNGVLITPRDVLSAASCVITSLTPRNASDLLVIAGTIQNSANAPGTVSRSVQYFSITSAPELNPMQKYSQLAVLRLNSSLETEGTASIATLGREILKIGASCSICGWGANTTSGSPANILQTLNMDVQSKFSLNCTRASGGTSLTFALCAGNPLQTNSGACTGDLGAPLMCNGALHGVLTNAGRCGGLHEVSIFADVTLNLDWIRNLTDSGVVVVPPSDNKPGGNGPGGSAQTNLQLGMMVIAVLTAFVLR